VHCQAENRNRENRTGRLDYKQTGLYSCGMGRTRGTSEARRRILETADRLFYQDGIRAVGIDRIIAEAGVAKMSLYRHFGDLGRSRAASHGELVVKRL